MREMVSITVTTTSQNRHKDKKRIKLEKRALVFLIKR